MYLFIGLGNPGERFSKNRHNIGFMVIDYIAEKNNFPKFINKNCSFFSSESFNGKKLILLKPNTFMNNSGISAFKIKSFYNIKNENIYVFHDEIDLEASRIKVKTAGGNNGHNGLKSLDDHIGKDYHRIRIGVGRPKSVDKYSNNEKVSKWVLSDFSKKEKNEWVNSTLEKISNCFEDLLKKNFNDFLTNFSSNKV
tara:strand:- start:586 stop:1173 length:588 start_codon:yes stop_codon:yes gene_type:complete